MDVAVLCIRRSSAEQPQQHGKMWFSKVYAHRNEIVIFPESWSSTNRKVVIFQNGGASQGSFNKKEIVISPPIEVESFQKSSSKLNLWLLFISFSIILLRVFRWTPPICPEPSTFGWNNYKHFEPNRNIVMLTRTLEGGRRMPFELSLIDLMRFSCKHCLNGVATESGF